MIFLHLMCLLLSPLSSGSLLMFSTIHLHSGMNSPTYCALGFVVPKRRPFFVIRQTGVFNLHDLLSVNVVCFRDKVFRMGPKASDTNIRQVGTNVLKI